MHFSRRKALGVAVGGIAAAPAMAKQALQPLPSSYPQTVQANVATANNPLYQDLARVKRLAAGDIRDSDRDYPTSSPPNHYDALKSVSEATKRHMIHDLYERQWLARTMKKAQDALTEYDKTGILRYFY